MEGTLVILTNRQIEEAVKCGDLQIVPFDVNQVQPASYDLRVGPQGATTSAKKLVNIKDAGFLLLEPGDFGILTVLEEIRLGHQYVARFGLRSKYARKGLIATTGPQIDPGYHGRLILGITNLTPEPITVPYGDSLVTVEFHRLEEASTKPYAGPFQDKMELRPEDVEFIVETSGMALSEVMKTLRSLSQSVGKLSLDVSSLAVDVSSLTKDVQRAMWITTLIVGFGIAVIAVIVALK
jgi:dCTP deaminase